MQKAWIAQSKSTIVKFIVVQRKGFIAVIEEHELDERHGPDYLGFSYCCDGRVLPKITTKLSLNENEEDGNVRQRKLATNSAITPGTLTEKGTDVIAMKVAWSTYPLEMPTVWYVTLEAANARPRQLFEDRPTRSVRFRHLNLHLGKTRRRTTKTTSKDYSLDISNRKDDAIGQVIL